MGLLMEFDVHCSVVLPDSVTVICTTYLSHVTWQLNSYDVVDSM